VKAAVVAEFWAGGEENVRVDGCDGAPDVITGLVFVE